MQDTQLIKQNLIGYGSVRIKSLNQKEEFVPDVCIMNKTEGKCLAYRKIKNSVEIIELYEIKGIQDFIPFQMINANNMLKIDSDVLTKEMFELFMNESFSVKELYGFGIALLGLHQLNRVKIFSAGVIDVVNQVSEKAQVFNNENVVSEISKILHQIGDLREEEEKQYRDVDLELENFYKEIGIRIGLLPSEEDE